MSEFEQVKFVHDYLAEKVYYGFSDTCYHAYGAVVAHKAVCQGYTQGFNAFMKKLGIQYQTIRGNISTGAHEWGMLRVDNEWYYMDVTGDSRTTHNRGELDYTYFLKDEETMRATHEWRFSPYPATSGKYRYYPQGERPVLLRDVEEAKAYLKKMYLRGVEPSVTVTMRFPIATTVAAGDICLVRRDFGSVRPVAEIEEMWELSKRFL